MKFSIVHTSRPLLTLMIGLLLHAAGHSAHAASTTLIASNSTWNYLADGSNQGTGWRAAAFDDSGWSNGMAKLGFGGDGEVTPIGFATNGFITFYFRTSFTEPGTNPYTQLQARLLRDDGAVVYLNGAEIFRQNMPNGTVTHLTQASSAVGGATENTFFSTNVSSALLLLQPGLNTVAVELHQNTNTSSDIGFNFELVALSDSTPPSVSLTNPISPATFIAGNNIALGATAGDDSGVAQVEFYANGLLVSTDTASPYSATLGNARFGGYTLTAVAQDVAGLRATSAPVTINVTLETNAVTLVPNHACWHYWDRGAFPGSEWMLPGFDDSAWPLGIAELGYGDGDESAVVSFGTNASNKHITTYFRHQFSVANPALFSAIKLRLKRDDGGVVYLNGTEVFRDNLPVGPVVPLTLADLAADDGAAFVETTISASLLVHDHNVLAVEIHQNTNTSSDISFDLSLSAETDVAALELLITPAGANMVRLSWPESTAAGFVLQSRPSADAGAWLPVANLPTLESGRYTMVRTTGGASTFYRLCTTVIPAGCQPPVVLSQPVHVTGELGTDVTLNVLTAGTAPTSYRWFHNNLPVPMATSPSLSILNLLRSDGGRYELCASNECGLVFSCPITVVAGGRYVELSDDFAGRPLFNALSGAINSSNFFATAEPGEPPHVGRAARKSMWLRYVAAAPGIVTFSTEGSAFDTLLAAYAGGELNALSPIDEDDDSGPAYSSKISFALLAGEEVSITVDAVPEQAGVFQLTWSTEVRSDVVPLILVHPESQQVPLGGDFTLSVVATNPRPAGPLTYQWRRNGLDVPGATNSTLLVTNVHEAEIGDYVAAKAGRSSRPFQVCREASERIGLLPAARRHWPP